MVKHIFITLTKVDSLSISIQDITRILEGAFNNQNIKVSCVCESHKDSSKHYHVLVILEKGISKNTYKRLIRGLFPMFEGRGIDISGVRNLKHIIKYMLKRVGTPNDIFIYGIDVKEFLTLGGMSDLAIAESIKGFKSFESWKNDTLVNKSLYYKNPKKCILIWEDVQSRRVLRLESITTLLDGLEYDPEDIRIDLPKGGIMFLLKMSQILFMEHNWKQTNIILHGAPNVGKTSFFKIFEKVFHTRFF